MRVLAALLILALVGAAGAAAFVYSGLYDVAATQQHTAPVFWVLKTTMRRTVQEHARSVVVPPLGELEQVAHGRTLFVSHCSRCHGAPGVAPEPFALGLRPAPANLANTGIEWAPAELFWTIAHGLKLTAMPAWQFRLSDAEIWAIVAYIQHMPYESPRGFRDALLASGTPLPPRFGAPPSAPVVSGTATGDPDRGRHVLQQYACITCHDIPGAVGAAIPVGPPLSSMGLRSYVGGVLANTQENLAHFLRAPQRYVPDGAMPDLGVTERDARDMAAYLESLR